MISNLIHFFKDTQRSIIGVVFAFNGLIYGSFITRIPEIQNRLEISDGILGGALFAAPLGALLVSFFIGKGINHNGAGKITFWSSIVFAFAFFAPILASSLTMLVIGLFILGAGMGAMDISMNAAAAYIEEQQETLIMSTSHGLWSLGGMAGAASTSLLLSVEFPLLYHLALISISLILFLLAYRNNLVKIKGSGDDGPIFKWPEPQLLLLATIAFCIFLSEGAIADWSAVYLQNYLGASQWVTGWGFAAFSLAMAFGRFYGDKVLEQYGSKRVLSIGALVGMLAFITMILANNELVALFCFALAGIGFAGIVPAIFGEAGRLEGATKGANIAVIGSIGYIGLLIGPPIIGLAAELIGLGYAFSLVVLLSGIAWLLSQRINS